MKSELNILSLYFTNIYYYNISSIYSNKLSHLSFNSLIKVQKETVSNKKRTIIIS